MYVMSVVGMYGCMTCKSGNTVQVKAAGVQSSQPYHHYVPTLEIWEPEYPGTVRTCRGLKWDSLTISKQFLHM